MVPRKSQPLALLDDSPAALRVTIRIPFHYSCLRLALVFVLFGQAGCGGDATVSEKSTAAMHAALKPKLTHTVAAVSYPLQYFTQRIVGSEIEVFCPGEKIVKDQSWQPSPEEVAAMRAADLVIANGPGAPFADWLSRVSLPQDKICNSAMDLATRDFIMVKDYKIVHQHGPEGEHSHPFMVAHTWLDPAIAKKQSTKIAAELTKTYPDLTDTFKRNLKSLDADLDQLSAKLAGLKQEDAVDVLTINPSLKFLTRAAGLNDLHMNWLDDDDDGKRSSQLELAAIEIRGQSKKVVHLLVPKNSEFNIDATPGSDVAERLNIEVHAINAFDTAPPVGDYMTEMEANISQLQQVFGSAD